MNVKKQDSIAHFRHLAFIATGITFILAAAVSIFSPHLGGVLFRDSYSDFEAGKIADRDVFATESMEYVVRGKTENLTKIAESATPPVYVVNEKAILESLHSFERFVAIIEDQSESGNIEQLTDRLENQLSIEIPSDTLSLMLSDRKDFGTLMAISETLIADIMKNGVFDDVPVLENGRLELRKWENGTKASVILTGSDLIIPGRIDEHVRSFLAGTGIDEASLRIVEHVTRSFIRPNVKFDALLTSEAKGIAADMVEPVINQIQEGERIIRKGLIVTGEDMEKLRAIGDAGGGIEAGMISGMLLYLSLIFFLAYILLYSYLIPRWRALQYLVLMLSFWLLFFFFAGFTFLVIGDESSMLSSFFLPTALVSMVITSMIGPRPAFLLILVATFSIVPVITIGKMDLVFIIFSGLMGIHVVISSERRIDLLRGGAIISGVHLLLVILIGLLLQNPFSWFLTAGLIAVANAMICTILNLSVLPLIEHMLNAPTVFRLIELSDMNTPLFKRMIMVAPGTYSHSVSVANMAESACRAIGANHLLARVGAYYHDIGKIEQPEYFIENQTGNNKHDELKPSLSVAVIKSHVKIGLEKAKDLKLPPEVVDIIGQHHGNGLIEYFYMEAVKNGMDDQKIKPEEYSYHGSPPVSREAAVVMLADTIEAATRTLKKPTVAKLEKFIWTKIMEKVTNRQMVNCELTFRDLEKIKQSFVQILAGHFHSRIEYPKMEEGKRKDNE
jgi:putative nucleotidyltransferase with HDIG domain